jgi:hypothetical protein
MGLALGKGFSFLTTRLARVFLRAGLLSASFLNLGISLFPPDKPVLKIMIPL